MTVCYRCSPAASLMLSDQIPTVPRRNSRCPISFTVHRGVLILVDAWSIKKKTKTLRVTLLRILPKKSSADCKLWGLDFHHKALFKIMLNQKFTLWGRISEQGPIISSLNGFPVDLPSLNCPGNLGCWAPGSDAPRTTEGWGLELLQLLKVQEMKSEAKSTSNKIMHTIAC